MAFRNSPKPFTNAKLSFQLNVTIFAFSSYDLLFNLYPLKAGWQPLPELHLEYVNHHQLSATVAATAKDGKVTPAPSETSDQVDQAGNESHEAQLKAELDALVKRWMPKAVFIHVSFFSANYCQ